MNENINKFRDVLSTLNKRRQIIVNVFFAFIIVSMVVSFFIPASFEAETSLRVKQPKGLNSSLLEMVDPLYNKQLMGTYSEILKSRTVVQEVIDKTQNGKATIPTYEDMVKQITTQPVKDTEILKVKLKGSTPEDARDTVNTLVDCFLGRLATLNRAEQSVIREFVGERLIDSKQELERAETALESYKRTQRLVSLPDQSKALVDRMSGIDKLRAENRVSMAIAQAKTASAERQLANEKPGFVAESPFITQYKAKLADLEVELVGLLGNYTENYPKVIEVRRAINETKTKLDAEILRIVSADAASMNPIHQSLLQLKIQSEAELAASVAQKSALEALIHDGNKEIEQLPAKEQGLTQLVREAQVAQEIYTMLAKRYEEARINEVMLPTEVQVIDGAIAPEFPVSPRKLLNAIVAGIVGLLVGFGMAFYLEYANRKIQNSREAERVLSLPVLGSIPEVSLAETDRRTPFYIKTTFHDLMRKLKKRQ